MGFGRLHAVMRKTRLLAILAIGARHRGELASELGISSPLWLSRVYLSPQMEMGLIERIDPGHPNSPQQKYALTKDGKRRIERVAPL